MNRSKQEKSSTIALYSLALLVFILSSCRSMTLETLSDTSGFPNVEKEFIEQDYTFAKTQIEQAKLELYMRGKLFFKLKEGRMDRKLNERKIVKDLLENDSEYIQKIAKTIIEISQIYKIDPFIFASLIAHESWFISNSCYSGGCGLTQLTGFGIQEVSDQLNEKKGAHSPDANDYLMEKINLLKQHSIPFEIIELQRRRSLTRSVQQLLKEKWQTNIVYGAMLLKVYLAIKALKYKSSANVSNNLTSIYREALRQYNGHPTNKKCYPTKIIQQALKLYEFHGQKNPLKEKDILRKSGCGKAQFPDAYFTQQGQNIISEEIYGHIPAQNDVASPSTIDGDNTAEAEDETQETEKEENCYIQLYYLSQKDGVLNAAKEIRKYPQLRHLNLFSAESRRENNAIGYRVGLGPIASSSTPAELEKITAIDQFRDSFILEYISSKECFP
ncbi:MAG: hypothetical protein R3B45_02925 [Bdellovibrionota bacterium]